MRVVLDTNILARAAASRSGPAGEVFERIAAQHVLVVSSELLAELAEVLSYERVRQMHRLGEAGIAAFIESIECSGRWFRCRRRFRALCPTIRTTTSSSPRRSVGR